MHSCEICKVTEVLPRKLCTTRCTVDKLSKLCINIHTENVHVTLQKSQVVKACVLSKVEVDKTISPSCLYCGNYASSKLLLSRLSWQTDSLQFRFFDLSVSLAYKPIIQSTPIEIFSIQRWQDILHLPILDLWPKMIQYIHNPILTNKTKEVLD
jgi:hypothetical protein